MNSIFRKEAFAGFLFFIFALSGCASIDPNDYRQTILVTSQPAGALVFDRGMQVGVTPAYVRVRRRLHPEITLRYPGNPETVAPLKTHYRWGDSFGSDFLFLTFAPVGWIADISTGNAWKIDDPPEFKFSGRAAAPQTDVIAIAPPEAPDIESADALGLLLEQKVGGLSEAWVLSYKDTAPTFNYHGSDHGLSKNPRYRYNLFYQLKASEIFISKAEPSADGYVVSGRLQNVFTGKEGALHTWELTSSDGSLKDQFNEHRFFTEYFHIFPNTAFLNLADYQPTLVIDGLPYKGRSARGNSAVDDVANYISYIGLSHLDKPRANIKGHFTFDFIPTLNVSQKKIFFDSYSPIRDIEFDRFYAGGGYGIEIGHLSRAGFFYFDLVPQPSWTQIHMRAPKDDERFERFSITYQIEVGYSRFITDHLVGRVFARSINEDTKLWQDAIHKATGKDDAVTGVTSGYAGIAIGYYLPSSLNPKDSWKVVEKKSSP